MLCMEDYAGVEDYADFCSQTFINVQILYKRSLDCRKSVVLKVGFNHDIVTT